MKNEIWADVLGFNGHYRVSNLGRVMSMGTCRTDGKVCKQIVLKQSVRKRDGYSTVNLYLNGVHTTAKVHQLVATAHVSGKRDGYVPDHLNGIRSDNRAENISWVSLSTNSRRVHTCRSATGHIGVFHNEGKSKPYRCLVTVNYRKKFVGSFYDIASAVAARDAFMKSLGE